MALDLPALKQPIAQGVSSISGEQSLSAPGQTHNPRSERLGKTFDFRTLGAPGNVFDGVVTQSDRTDVQPDSGSKIQLRERGVITQGKACCVLRIVE
jgi:hypothetical protein